MNKLLINAILHGLVFIGLARSHDSVSDRKIKFPNIKGHLFEPSAHNYKLIFERFSNIENIICNRSIKFID